MIVDLITGARPNFMKVAALFAVAKQFPALTLRLIHTGQHADPNMSDVFLQELGLPEPACRLNVGGGSHAIQTAGIMIGYETWLSNHPADMAVLVGDVNSTVACALVAAKEGVKVAHVEAGLRSFDRRMPEEINRILTDSLSDLMFVTEPSGLANLAREGRPLSAIHLVGHVMIDTLLRMRPQAEVLAAFKQFGLTAGHYAYLTLHRPSNVDQNESLRQLCDQIEWLAARIPVIFPVHPRTRARLESSGLATRLAVLGNLCMTTPVSYITSLSLLLAARLVVTDSGGLQEESTVAGVPCLTLRENTERPITVEAGTNTLIGHDWVLFRSRVDSILASSYPYQPTAIPYWDGQSGARILRVIQTLA